MSDGHARLFVALELPEAVRGALAGWAGRELAGHAELRVLDATSLHVTLCFLGERPLAEAAAIGQAAAACARPLARLEVGASAWLPPRRPRVLAVDLGDGGGSLTSLQADVASAMGRAAGHVPERRPFRPHVTVARVRGSAVVRPWDLAAPEIEPFDAPSLALLRSYTGQAGARYEVLVRVRLGTA